MKVVKMLFIAAKAISELNKLDKKIVDSFWDAVKAEKNLHSVYKKYPKGHDTNGFYAIEDKASTKFFKQWSETFENALNGTENADSSVFEAQLAMLQSLPQNAAIKKAIKTLIADNS
jgi:truncated hemoglobin YjbI